MASRLDYLFPATADHVDHIGRRLRAEHVREVASGTRVSPLTALRLSLKGSAVAYAAVIGGVPVFVMGAMPAGVVTGCAEVWMLGTEDIDRHPARILRAGRWGVAEAYRATGALRLEQWIPSWYETGIRFVERLEFVPHHGGDVVHVVHDRRIL